MHIVYAFIIINLKSCVICMETDKHYCKYLIHRSIMYCLIYCESKLIDLIIMCKMHGNRKSLLYNK